ncbi:MAG TPA: OmpA family protein [Gemmatimonadales bacterium]|nr:OmpA family protein [Gemmatimonadales bacterium]
MDHSHKVAVALIGFVLTTGCGKKEVVEAPEPVTQAPVATAPAATPAPAPAPAPASTADDRYSTLEQRIHFALDRADLDAEARSALDSKAEILQASPNLTLRISGHADERGSDEYNLALSKRRSTEAKRFLVSRGVDPSRLETVGYGEEQPLANGTDEAAWSMNRRDEFVVTGGKLSQR